MVSCVVDSPIGHLRLDADDIGICAIGRTEEALLSPNTPLLRACAEQLDDYFDGSRRTFDLPLHLTGTPFRMACWKALCQIPYGETRTYGQQAQMLGKPKACRAVGGANHANPIMIIVPCHRVIGADGSLIGYGGGMDIKAWLLRHEQVHAAKA